MSSSNGFQFIESDLAIVRYVHELRIATIDNVAMLSDRSYKQTQKRLSKLEEAGYLTCYSRRPNKHVYGLARKGVSVLIEQGFAPRELAERRLRENELHEFGIRHAIFIANIHVKLLRLARAQSLAIPIWVEGSALWDSVTTSDDVSMPIRPDARFAIEGPAGRAHYFLEADRGTMAHSRMREKITGYAAYFQQQRHGKKYPGMKVFRVATITETRGRADSLAAEYKTMMPAAWLAAYPVMAFEDLGIDRLTPELAGDKRA